MLKDSLLPPKYYDEAQRTASYLFNRTVHGNEEKTPYELIFNKLPDISHLKPFGVVCYAFLSPEKRSKLDDSAIKCRLIGYGNDFGLEEMKAFKLLKEDDGTIIWSDNCIFDANLKTERLPDIFYSTDDNQIMDEFWIDEAYNSSDSEKGEELDSEDDAFFDAEDEELSEEESSNLISYLMTDKWWMSDEYNNNDFCHAYRAVTDGIPSNFSEAMQSEDKAHWKAAMDCKMKNIRDNGTY